VRNAVCVRRRRIRELNENNTKKFIDERKRQAIIQSRQIEAARKTHQEQLAKLGKDLDWVGPMYMKLLPLTEV